VGSIFGPRPTCISTFAPLPRMESPVLVHSSDLDEVLLLADRIVVVCRGELLELPPPFERGRVGQAMLGVPSA
jgi:ABC-type uncharacterized transport system ATPase subunit